MFDERSFLKGEEYTSTSSVVAVEHMEAMDMEEDDRRKEERRALLSIDERAERFILFVVWFMFLEKGQAGTWLPSLVWWRMGNGRAVVGVRGQERSKCEVEKWWVVRERWVQVGRKSPDDLSFVRPSPGRFPLNFLEKRRLRKRRHTAARNAPLTCPLTSTAAALQSPVQDYNPNDNSTTCAHQTVSPHPPGSSSPIHLCTKINTSSSTSTKI